MNPIEDAWHRIENWCSKNLPNLVFGSGCSKSELKNLETTLAVKLPKAFRESCSLHNGENGSCCFPYGMFLLSLDGIVREWQQRCELFRVDPLEDYDDSVDGAVKRMDWNAKWIPFASNDSGECYFLDLDPGSLGTVGQVVDFSHEEGPVRLLGTTFENFMVDYANALDSGVYAHNERSDIHFVDENALRKAENRNRLSWTPRKKNPSKASRTAKSNRKESVQDEKHDAEAVVFLNEFLLSLRQWKEFCKKKQQELKEGMIANDPGRPIMHDELRTIYRKNCQYSSTFPFGFIDDAPFSDPEGSTVVSVTEQGEKTLVILQLPEKTNECVQYTVIKTPNKGLRITCRDVVEDLQNVEAIGFLKQFLAALRELGLEMARKQESGGHPFENSEKKLRAIFDKYVEFTQNSRIRVDSFSNPPSNDPDRSKILSVMQKGSKTYVVLQRPKNVFDDASQKWIDKNEWLCQDPSRINDLYRASGIGEGQIMQYTLIRTDGGFKVSEKVKMFVKGENRFVSYMLM